MTNKLLFAAVLCFLPWRGYAQDGSSTKEEDIEEQTLVDSGTKLTDGRKIYLSSEFLSLKIAEESSLSTLGAGVTFIEPLTQSLSFGLNFNQGYSAEDQYTSLFYGNRISVLYSILGTLNSEESTYSVESVTALSSKNKKSRYHVGIESGLSHYFFNTGEDTVSFSGFNMYLMGGGELFGFDLSGGVGFERLSSGRLLLLPIRAFFRVGLDLY